MTHYWRVRRWLAERYGQKCRLVVKWSKNGNIMIEFEDKVRIVTSRWNVRRLKP